MTETRTVAVALDSSTDQLAMAVVDFEPERGLEGVRLLAERNHRCRRQANVNLIPELLDLLAEAGRSVSDVGRVIVGRGPGSFTGVRIGIATAKGLAVGLQVPLLGVSTLDAVAWGAWRHGTRGLVGVVDDAMRGEVYPGLYQVDDTGAHRLFPAETVERAGEAARAWRDRDDASLIQLTGDGLVKYLDLFAGDPVAPAGVDGSAPAEGSVPTEGSLPSHGLPFAGVLDERHWYPEGLGLALAAGAPWNFDAADEGDPSSLLPIYTRLSDAEENELRRLGMPEPASVRTTGVAEALADRHLQLRPMGLSDLEQVSLLENAVFADTEHTPWSSEIFAAELADPKHPWWVAHDQGRVVGFAGGRLCGSDLEIEDVVVEPARRREGVARRLVARVANDGRDLGATTASLEVFEENHGARALYDALGFEERGRRPDYYGAGRDALILCSELPLANGDEVVAETARPRRAWPPRPMSRDPEAQSALDAAGDLVLAIETSCDETAMAVTTLDGSIVASVVASQIDFHARFGGVVPEIASRKHTEAIVGVYEEVMERAGGHFGLERLEPTDLRAVGVTQGPGLVGALVVGVAFAKGLCAAADLDLVGVNHLEAHLFANLLVRPDLEPPFVASLVSGGHTMLVYVEDWGRYQVMGQTIDDAVGEAFDKVAKALGLGYPGGPVIQRLAEQGDPKAIDFPRALLHSHGLDFSLSGLKTAVVTYLANEERAGRAVSAADVAASFQAAVIDVQVAKAVRAVEEKGVGDFCLGGGVAANKALREAYERALGARGVRVTVPPLAVCTDNAQMVALVAARKLALGETSPLTMDADPNLSIESRATGT